MKKQIPWNKLTLEEKKVVQYFLTYKSVGDLIIIRDLRLKGIQNPTKVLENLIQKGIIVKGEGCYSLSKEYR